MGALHVYYACMTHHLRMNIPVGYNYFPYQVQAVPELTFSPSRYKPVEPACTCRIRNNAIFALYTIIPGPLSEFPHETVRNLMRELPPVLKILAGKDLPELRNSIICHIDQTCGIVNYQAYWMFVKGIKDPCRERFPCRQVNPGTC